MKRILQNSLTIQLFFLIPFLSLCGQEADSDNFAVAGKWKLATINGEFVAAGTYTQGIPYLEFKDKDPVMSGYTGCNVIQGEFQISGNSLKFGQIISTKRFCEGIPENDFLEALDRTNSYAIDGNTLYLLSAEVRLLSFIKDEY